jgi:hypothetical protein
MIEILSGFPKCKWWPFARTLIWFGFGSTKVSRRRRWKYVSVHGDGLAERYLVTLSIMVCYYAYLLFIAGISVLFCWFFRRRNSRFFSWWLGTSIALGLLGAFIPWCSSPFQKFGFGSPIPFVVFKHEYAVYEPYRFAVAFVLNPIVVFSIGTLCWCLTRGFRHENEFSNSPWPSLCLGLLFSQAGIENLKILFKNVVMLMVLFTGTYLLGELNLGFWKSGVGRLYDVPIWCKALEVFADIAWLVVCIIFGKPLAVFGSQIIGKVGFLFGTMTKRKKYIVSAFCLVLVFASLVFCWSPQARVRGDLSWFDLIRIRLALRCYTFSPIYSIEKEGGIVADASVTAGAMGSLRVGDRYYYYAFYKSTYGWNLAMCCPVSGLSPSDSGRNLR